MTTDSNKIRKMYCELLFFYDINRKNKSLIHLVEQFHSSCKIITNSSELNDHLNKLGRDSELMNEVVPENGPLAEQVYQYAKKIFYDYESVFQNMQYNKMKIFTGFEYNFLRQLILLMKAKLILEKKENVIFVFKRYYPIYFAIIKMAKDLGYTEGLKIGFVKNTKIEYINQISKGKILSHEKNFSLHRSLHFIRTNFNEKSYMDKIKVTKRVLSQLISYTSKKLFLDKNSIMQNTSKIFKSIDDKILNTDSKFNATTSFFVTASRLDYYFRPWIPILKKFEESGILYNIFTSDLLTGLALSKEKLSHISLFEEVNALTYILKQGYENNLVRDFFHSIENKKESLYCFNELKDFLQSQSYRSLAILIICEYIIKKMKLQSIVAIADGEMLENSATTISRKYEIPSYTIIIGQLEPQPILSDWFHSDKIFIEGSKLKETLTSLGYNENRLVLTGNPFYDNYKNLDQDLSKKILKDQYGIDPNKKLVLIAMSRIHNNDESWISNLIKFCNQKEYEIFVKIHPAYRSDEDSRGENLIYAIKKECPDLRYFIAYDTNIMTLISASDFVLTEYSDVGMEAIALSKPLITVNFDNKNSPLSYYIQYHQYDASIYVDDYKKLEEVISEILENNGFSSYLENGRKKFLALYSTKLKNSPTDMIFDILIGHNRNI